MVDKSKSMSADGNGIAASLMIIMVRELFLLRNGGKVGCPEIVLLSATTALAEDISPAGSVRAVSFVTRDIHGGRNPT